MSNTDTSPGRYKILASTKVYVPAVIGCSIVRTLVYPLLFNSIIVVSANDLSDAASGESFALPTCKF